MGTIFQRLFFLSSLPRNIQPACWFQQGLLINAKELRKLSVGEITGIYLYITFGDKARYGYTTQACFNSLYGPLLYIINLLYRFYYQPVNIILIPGVSCFSFPVDI